MDTFDKKQTEKEQKKETTWWLWTRSYNIECFECGYHPYWQCAEPDIENFEFCPKCGRRIVEEPPGGHQGGCYKCKWYDKEMDGIACGHGDQREIWAEYNHCPYFEEKTE